MVNLYLYCLCVLPQINCLKNGRNWKTYFLTNFNIFNINNFYIFLYRAEFWLARASSTVQIQTTCTEQYKYRHYVQYSTNTDYMYSTVQIQTIWAVQYKYRFYEQYSTNTNFMSSTVQIQTIWAVQYKYRLYE